MSIEVPDDLASLAGRLTCTVPEAGRLLGIGRDAAYAAAERGELPCLRLGRRLIVPVPRLLDLLGAASTQGPPHDPTKSGGHEGIARRRITATTGVCPCGASVDFSDRLPGQVAAPEVLHDRHCPAGTDRLVKACRRWAR